MIKIYLDQKDYIRIARGLLGDPIYQRDIESYHYLLDKVDSGDIRIYFSLAHLIEELQYHENGSQSLDFYCDAVDKLTLGNCIINPNEIEKRELELFLAERLGFATKLSQENYPYGKYGDAFSLEKDSGTNLKVYFRNNLKSYIRSQPIPGRVKKLLIRQVDSPQGLRKLLRGNLNENDLRKISQEFPGTEKMSKEDIITMLTSTQSADKVDQFASSIFSFKNLLTHYRTRFPEFKRLKTLFEEPSKSLIQLIGIVQLFHSYYDKPIKIEDKLIRMMTGKSLERFDNHLKELSEVKKFSLDKAKDLLIESNLKEIKSVYVFILTTLEYYKRHKGKIGEATKPKDNDLMDIIHMRFLPYVDCILADKRFVEFSKNVSNQFNTKVLKNLDELKSYIEQVI